MRRGKFQSGIRVPLNGLRPSPRLFAPLARPRQNQPVKVTRNLDLSMRSRLVALTNRGARSLLLFVVAMGPIRSGIAAADDGIAFFESKIRPVLVERCYKCHSNQPRAPKGGLRVDSREALLRGGDSGPAVVPGKPEGSLLFQAICYDGDAVEMPPNEKLPDQVLADFRRWIASGAAYPQSEHSRTTNSVGNGLLASRDFWAFRPASQPRIPAIRDRSWPRSDADCFILAKHEARGLQPVSDADRYTWLRRVSLDVSGLPPSREQIADFIADSSPQAYERVVDRLLASPAFGERWARHWLDLTGYADQIGTANDIFAEHAWRYRDYVIAAFNADKPFDRFVREQVAGDLLPYDSIEERAANLVATGFLLLGDLTIVEADKAKLRIDVVDQQVDKVGKAFLGLSIGCARCHDHKFDPISQRDYYAVAGIFQSTESIRRAEWGVWSWPMFVRLPETLSQQVERVAESSRHRQRFTALTGERDRAKKRQAEISARLQGKARVEATERVALEKGRRELDARLAGLNRDIEHAEFFAPAAPVAFAVHDSSAPADMRITIRGNAHALGDSVPRGFVSAISHNRAPSISKRESGRRQLADWIASADNPLTARVVANRIWQHLFGEGIVRSVDYFGARGDVPSHAELLDSLAARLISSSWSQKCLIRHLVLSRAYRMSSAHNTQANAIDPENRLLWRMNRRRLDAESLRDSLLAVSGSLIACRGGPGLPLEYPENTGGLGKGGVNPPSFRLVRFRPEQQFVRTVYLPVVRSMPQPGPAEVRNVFDFTLPGELAGQRAVTTVPTQALFLTNAQVLKKQALELARRTTRLATTDTRLDYLWLLALNRPIMAVERAEAVAFLGEVRSLNTAVDAASQEIHAWSELSQAVLTSNEFLVRL
jgi:hypothetical protein